MRGDPRKGYVHYMDTGGARQGEERGRGVPRTEEARKARHEELYPGEPVPDRGTGLRQGTAGTIGTAMLLGLAVVVVIAVMGACKKK